MKKRVELSSYCWIISALATAIMCGVMVHASKQPDNTLGVWIIGSALALLFLSALFFTPRSISLDNNNLNINRSLKTKSIPLSAIADVRLCSPAKGTIRICDSGGWFGWYGWFRNNRIGKYFAYYGKASDCFLVTLKDGRKYMLGCIESSELVGAINKKLSN